MRRLAPLCSVLAALVCAGPAAAVSEKPVCPGPVSKPATRCHAHVVTDSRGRPLGKPTPQQGALYAPDLRSAYNVVNQSVTNGAGTTIAIVDAYHYPTALNDLNVYRAEAKNGSMAPLPACSVNSSGACFQQVDQNGGTNFPALDGGWAQEAALDIDMASAMCPNCKILLVEGNSSSLDDLGTAVNTAVGMGADVVSNSYGTTGEFSSEGSYAASYYDHPGVALTVSSGDAGYGVEFPAVANTVTAVGGTSLKRNSNGTFSETAWNGAGSGCSALISQQSWQSARSDITGCSNRVVADVSADADPATGVAVYDSTPYQNASGWLKFGGTSVAAPLIGGVYALNVAWGTGYATPLAYANTGALHDVTSGSNARRCSPSYLCTARTGYDGPTGLGTPNGVAAF